MKHAVTYLIAGAVLVGLGIHWGGFALLLVWLGVACLLVGLAYGGVGAAVFGKREDGTLPPWTWVLLLPYLVFTWAIWKLKRKVSKEPFHNEVAPGLWVGRRVLGAELPEGVAVIADVTCEFAEPSSALARGTEDGSERAGKPAVRVLYRCLPTLNYSVPERKAFEALVAELVLREGVYIHCAQGHGRSATLAAGVLLGKGLARTWEEAVAMVVAVRPKVHLEPCQEQFLRTLYAKPE